MPQFKRGDKARILKALHGHRFLPGEIVEVVFPFFGKDQSDIEGYQCKNERGEESAVGVDEIELVQAREPQKGDKAKVLAHNHKLHDFFEGEVVEFTGNKIDQMGSLLFKGDKYTQWLNPGYYEWI